MTNTQTVPCSKCGALIPLDDFEQGLAVKDGDQNICKVCVDAGANASTPATPRQPLMQQNIYRFTHEAHDDLNRFTFLTAGHIALHRRVQREQGAFDPPELDANNNDATRVLSTRQAKKTTRRDTPLNQVKDQTTKKANPGIVIGAAVAVIVVIGIAIVLFTGNNEAQQDTTTAQQAMDTSPKKLTRSDFPSDPNKAWELAQDKTDLEPEIIESISQELIKKQNQILNKAASLIEAKDSVRALTFLNKAQIPGHAAFTDLKRRKDSLLEQRNALIAGGINDNTDIDTDPEKPAPDNKTENNDTDTVAIETLEFKPLLKLTSGITKLSNQIGNDSEMGLATANNCSNNALVKYQSYDIGENGYIAFNKDITYPHSFTINFFFKLQKERDKMEWLFAHGALSTKGSINVYLPNAQDGDNAKLRTVIGFNGIDSLEVPVKDHNLLDGAWHSYTLLVDHEKGAAVYLDKQLATSTANIRGPLEPEEKLILGASQDHQYNLSGSIALLQIYQGTNESKTLNGIDEIITTIKDNPQITAKPEFDFTPVEVTSIKPFIPQEDATVISSPLLKGSWKIETPSVPSKERIKQLRTIDYNNDGDLDLIGISSERRILLNNKGNGTFALSTEPVWARNSNVLHNEKIILRISDFNNDGLLDIAECKPGEGITLFINKGETNFEHHSLPSSVNSFRPNFHIADFNNDNRPDIMYQESKSGGQHTCVLNPGDLTQIKHWPRITLKRPAPAKHTNVGTGIADFNGDGYKDIFFQLKQPAGYAIYHNQEGTAFNLTTINDPNKPNLGGTKTTLDGTKLLGVLDRKTISHISITENAVHISEPTLNTINAQKLFRLFDLDHDGQEDFIHLNKQGHICLTVNGEKSQNLTSGAYGIDQEITYGDYNADGYMDFAHYGADSRKNYKLVIFLRKPNYQPTDTEKNTVAKTPTITIDPPVILNRLKAKRAKYVNIYHEQIDKDGPMLSESAPLLSGNYREVLDPWAVKAKASGRTCSTTIDLGSRDASNGGLLIILHPMDTLRKNISVIVEDHAGKKSNTITTALTGNEWQTVSVDLTSAGSNFDASNIKEIEIKDEAATSSISFLVHRILVYRDHVPNADSLSINPGIQTNHIRFNSDYKIMPRLLGKKIDLKKTVILMEPTLLDKSAYAFDLRKELTGIIGETLPAESVMQLGYDPSWLKNVFVKQILKKKKPKFIIAIGAGNSLNKKPDAIENDTFWKAFIKECTGSSVKALPVIIFGPHPGYTKGSAAWDPIIESLSSARVSKLAPLVDMSKVAYSKSDGSFLRNMRKQSIDDICRAFYQVLAFCDKIEEP